MFNDNQIKLSDEKAKKASDAATTTTTTRQSVDRFFLCAMLEPIKKEIKTEEKKRRGETRADRTKVFDVSSYSVEFKDVILNITHLLMIKRKFSRSAD